MDPIITGIMSGVITNCIIRLGSYLGGSKEKALDDKQREMQELIKKATEEVAETIDWEPPPRIEEVCLFITSPEVESIVRQIVSTKLLENGSQRNLKSIEREFVTSFALFVSESEEKLKIAAKKLFQALLKECEKELDNAINTGILAAHEAKSTIRYRIILDEVEAIGRNISFLSAKKTLDVQAVLEFEKKYNQQVSDRHGYIIPPHFDVARKIPIDDLYVMPYFTKRARKRGEDPISLTGMEFMNNTYRSIVLGDPGSGKSTFALKVCHDLSTNKMARCFCGSQLTPILVVLRDYGAEKKAQGYSILQYIEGVASSRYQLIAPAGAFEYLLLNGRTVVIFDGLDELLDTSYRQEISNDIDSFCTLYPSVPVLVTSRSVGYEQAPLDERRFEVFSISEFDDDQVLEYVTKWFASEQDFTPEQRKQKVNEFIIESQIVPDLRSNPLMLALMCNIYRGENYIPRNRPEVYEKCAMMLFERWDLSRGIRVALPFEAHIKPAMMYLAHWIYNNETLQGGVTEHQLVNEASKYLLNRRFEDPDQAIAAAREFIEFCRGRAWVFTDTGTTKEGEGLYQFTHRTFLEYFTASHLFRTHPTAASLEEVLLPRIIKREWDVVSQLSVQILNRNVEGAGDELLTSFLKQANTKRIGSKSRWTLISFISRCLEFIVPSPRVTRDITSVSIRETLDMYAFFVTNKKRRSRNQSLDDELIDVLLNTATENLAIVQDELAMIIVETAKSGDKAKSVAAIETGMFLPIYRQRDPKVTHYIPEKTFGDCVDIINTLRKEFYCICLGSFLRGKTTMSELVEWYGIQRVFMEAPFSTSENRVFAPLGLILTRDIILKKFLPTHWNYDTNKALVDLGRIFLTILPPWIEAKSISTHWFDMIARQMVAAEKENGKVEWEKITIAKSSFFGCLVLLALYLETDKRIYDKIIDFLTRINSGSFDRLGMIFKLRFGYETGEIVRDEIREYGLSAGEADLLWRWSQREVDFVKK